jgi:hypothetical protein
MLIGRTKACRPNFAAFEPPSAPQQGSSCKARRQKQPTAWQTPLGCRAHTRVVCWVRKAAHPIREATRYPSSLAHFGCNQHLLSLRRPVALANLKPALGPSNNAIPLAISWGVVAQPASDLFGHVAEIAPPPLELMTKNHLINGATEAP